MIVTIASNININQATTIEILPEGDDNAAIAIKDASNATNKVKAKKLTVTK